MFFLLTCFVWYSSPPHVTNPALPPTIMALCYSYTLNTIMQLISVKTYKNTFSKFRQKCSVLAKILYCRWKSDFKKADFSSKMLIIHWKGKKYFKKYLVFKHNEITFKNCELKNDNFDLKFPISTYDFNCNFFFRTNFAFKQM